MDIEDQPIQQGEAGIGNPLRTRLPDEEPYKVDLEETLQRLVPSSTPEPTPQANPDAAYDLKELRSELLSATKKLPDGMKTIVELKFGLREPEGSVPITPLTNRQIAEMLGVSETYINTTINNATFRMRQGPRSRYLNEFRGVESDLDLRDAVRAQAFSDPERYLEEMNRVAEGLGPKYGGRNNPRNRIHEELQKLAKEDRNGFFKLRNLIREELSKR